MRLPHFRVRTLMLAIALLALLVWGALMGTRAYDYGRLAREYGFLERTWRQHAVRDRAIPGRGRSVAAVWGPEIAAYYAPLARKYRRAMWRPWDPVAPDPPAPVFGRPRSDPAVLPGAATAPARRA
jgi:hypothetical protein